MQLAFGFGTRFGVTATGLLLLRVVDPDYETEAAEAFAAKQLLHEPFMGGGLWTGAAIPLLALWGEDGAIAAHFDCLALWKERARDVRGWALPGGHYVAEQHPQDVLDAWVPFFANAMAEF